MAKTPKLIVFDLDYTLWPFWVDTHVDPPFQMRTKGKAKGQVFDSRNREVTYYSEVPAVLKSLKSKGYTLAVASRTGATDDAISLLKLFNWDKYFTYKEIYPGSKVKHFQRFHELSGLPYTDMVFFDDEHRNIVDTKKLGVHAVLVEDGVNESVVKEGLSSFPAR